jgi:alanine dehydrogenase
MALSRFFRIEFVKVADVSEERRRLLEEDCRDHVRADYIRSEIKDACDCDILVTTTPSRVPLVRSSWIKPGTHINAIGADAKGKQELETILTKRAKVVVDDIAQASHSGEINVPISEGAFRPEDIHAQIGEILVGKVEGRKSPEEITIFDSQALPSRMWPQGLRFTGEQLAGEQAPRRNFYKFWSRPGSDISNKMNRDYQKLCTR